MHGLLWPKRADLREQVQENRERLEQLDAWLKQIEKENNMPAYSIRPARIETDLPDIVRITNPSENHPITVDQLREWFQYNPPGRVQRRLVPVDEQDAVTGYAGYVREADAAPNLFTVWVIVAAEHRGEGIGSALWETMLKELKALGAGRLRSEVGDRDAQSLAFAEHRGFAIAEHYFNYLLDLDTFDETPYLPAMDDLQARSIRFCALSDFPDTPQTRRKLYDLNISYVLDSSHPSAPWTFPGFEEFVIRAPWFRREVQLLAVDGDQWVGMAAVSVFPEPGTAYNLHTGVLPAYRRQKVATSLKVLAIRYARQSGAHSLLTDSNLRNTPILAINRKLGYTPQPGTYTLICDL